jgi:hypothetical protein
MLRSGSFEGALTRARRADVEVLDDLEDAVFYPRVVLVEHFDDFVV